MSEQTVNTTSLPDTLGFTREDLAANRAGEMSEMQHYALRVRRRRALVIGVLILLAVTFVATVLIFLGQKRDSTILTIIGIVVTICNAALMGLFARHWIRLSADIREGAVRATTGRLERIIKPVNRRVLNYMVRVGDAEVFVSKEAFMAFEHEGIYTIYRAPYTGTLFSAERVED